MAILNHGINSFRKDTNFKNVVRTRSGIPIYFGCAPMHKVGKAWSSTPVLAYSFDEAAAALGYSDEWRTASGYPAWTLCEAMYAQFKVAGIGPAIFVPLDMTGKTSPFGQSVNVVDHVAKVTADVMGDNQVSTQGSGGTQLEEGTDYVSYFEGDYWCVELLPTSTHYSKTSLNIGGGKYEFVPESGVATGVTATDIAALVENIEQCFGLFGIVPDLLVAPCWSDAPTVAAAMAAKAPSINGLFRAKAVVDISVKSSGGADAYDEVLTWKNTNGYTDENMIVCWPQVKVGDKLFDLSVIACGVMGGVDRENGCPYESPSNKTIPITDAVTGAGSIRLTIGQADVISCTDGVVTAFTFDGWRLWGNYMGCFPGEENVAKAFICTSRMWDWIGNEFIRRYWDKLDRPLTRVLVDSVVNDFNAFLAGLAGEGKIVDGKVEFVESNNPTPDLIAGRFRIDTSFASPTPAQRIDHYVEFDPALIASAFGVNA